MAGLEIYLFFFGGAIGGTLPLKNFARPVALSCRLTPALPEVITCGVIPEKQPNNPFRKTLSSLIFLSRWLQAPLYLGLIIAQAVYVWHFMVELWHLLEKTPGIKETEIIVIVLGLIDVVMISNLLIMVIVGGYETFVARLYLDDHPDQPEWLSHVNAGILKVKLASALIGISSIHLLKSFIGVATLTDRELAWQVGIHATFLISALALALIERMTSHVPSHTEVRRND